MKEKTYSENWGGARQGAGKKPTGRKKVNFYIDKNEEKMLREELEKYRSNGVTELKKRPPNSKDETSENQDGELRDKIEHNFEIAIQSAVACSLSNNDMAKDETLGELLCISNEEVVKKINAAAEQEAKIENTIKSENTPPVSSYKYRPKIPTKVGEKKAVDYKEYERKSKLKRAKQDLQFNDKRCIELRQIYKNKATLHFIEYTENGIYFWFSSKKKSDGEIFRKVYNDEIRVISSEEKYNIFGFIDRGFHPPYGRW